MCLSPPPNGSYHWSIAATVAVVEALKKKEDTETAAAAAGRIAPPALHSVRLSAPWHSLAVGAYLRLLKLLAILRKGTLDSHASYSIRFFNRVNISRLIALAMKYSSR